MRRRATLAWVAGLTTALGLIGAAAQQPPPPRDTPARPAPDTVVQTGRISGRVLDAATGRPMKLARVMLNAPEGRGRSTQTDESGTFDITGLAPGRYNLSVQKSGYITLAYGQRRPLQPGTPLQVEEGQHLKGIEFRMPRGSVISGTVQDELGDPMPGVPVRLMRFQYSQGVRQLTPAGGGQTDDRGIYRIWGLNPGEYFVSAVAPNFTSQGGPQGRGGRGGQALAGRGGPPPDAAGAGDDTGVGYAPTYYPGVPSVFEATPVNVGLGAEVLDINFNVLLVRTAAISGRIVNLDGTPVTAGNVNLTVDNPLSRQVPGVSFGSRIRWDGFFSIANVPPGRYLIRARGTDDTFPQFAVLPITVAGDDITDVLVALAPAASLAGTVTFQGAGAPGDLTQSRVTLLPGDQEAFGANVNGRVEKDGRFTLNGIPPGPYFVRASAPRGWILKSVLVDGAEMIDTPLDIRSGQKLAGATLVFSDRPTEVNGTVLDPSGQPVTDRTVLAFPTDDALWRPRARHIMTARPDQNGRFQLRGLPAGEYFMALIDPQQSGEWYDPAVLEQHRRDAARVTLAEGDTRTLDLKADR